MTEASILILFVFVMSGIIRITGAWFERRDAIKNSPYGLFVKLKERGSQGILIKLAGRRKDLERLDR